MLTSPLPYFIKETTNDYARLFPPSPQKKRNPLILYILLLKTQQMTMLASTLPYFIKDTTNNYAS